MANKPVVKVSNALVLKGHLYATLTENDHVRDFVKGENIRTSLVVGVSEDGKTIETQNTIYQVVDL